jgi:hypothetical protein
MSKIQEPYDFLNAVYDYEMVGPALGYWVAFLLPWFEMALGVCLLLGIFPLGSFALATVLLAVFTAARFTAATRELPIPCGCVREAVRQVGLIDALESGVIFGVALVGFIAVKARARSASNGDRKEQCGTGEVQRQGSDS